MPRSAGKLVVSFNLAGTSSPIDVAGLLDLQGRLDILAGPGFGPGTYTLFDYGTLGDEQLKVASAPGGYSYSISVDAANHQVDLIVGRPNVAPEPSSWLILGLGMAAIATRRRLRLLA